MSTEPAYLRNLKALSRADPAMEDVREIEFELYAAQSDRATGVLLGSFLETSVLHLIRGALRQDMNSNEVNSLFGYNGPAGSFSSKIQLAYAMGLIGKTSRDDLDLIRVLRNTFAHGRKPLSFKTPEISAVCKQLKMIDLPGSDLPVGYFDCVKAEDREAYNNRTDPKTRYVGTCHTLAYRMNVKRNGPQAGDTVFPDDEPLP